MSWFINIRCISWKFKKLNKKLLQLMSVIICRVVRIVTGPSELQWELIGVFYFEFFLLPLKIAHSHPEISELIPT